MFKALYFKTINLAGHKSSKIFLGIMSFIESFVFPIPPDVLIIPMTIAKKQDWIKIALIATIGSVLGACLGYFIGYVFFNEIGVKIFELYGVDNASFLKDKIGQQVFSNLINVIDKPDVAKGMGSQNFDSEGVKSQTLQLVEDGILKNYLVDTYNGKKLNLNSSILLVKFFDINDRNSAENYRDYEIYIHRSELIKNENDLFLVDLIGCDLYFDDNVTPNGQEDDGDADEMYQNHKTTNGLYFDPNDIRTLDYLMRKSKCEIGTLAFTIQNEKELYNRNIVKVETFNNLSNSNFLKTKNFFRTTVSKNIKNIYHHVGIYAFTKNALSKYVKLERSKNEIDRRLEQMRAIDNNIEIRVALSKSFPLGVDSEEDFLSIKKSMEYKS